MTDPRVVQTHISLILEEQSHTRGEDNVGPADDLVVVLESLYGPGLQASELEGAQHLTLQRLVDVVVVPDH
jgi:hypothetical protein